MSDDVEKQRKKSMKEKEKEANGGSRMKIRKDSNSSKKEDMEHGDWWIVRVAKVKLFHCSEQIQYYYIQMGFESCFQRRRITPSPPPTNETDLKSPVNAN